MAVSIYLAGPIQHEDDNGSSWRDDLKETYPEIDWLDPLDKYDFSNDDLTYISEEEIEQHDDPTFKLNAQVGEENDEYYVTPDDIVENDKKMIDEVDGVLVGWSEVPSAGTPMEVMYTYMLNELHPHRDRIPVVVWWRDSDPESHLSPWLEYHSDSVTEDRHEAAEIFTHLNEIQNA